jgi:hypothetical protein
MRHTTQSLLICSYAVFPSDTDQLDKTQQWCHQQHAQTFPDGINSALLHHTTCSYCLSDPLSIPVHTSCILEEAMS